VEVFFSPTTTGPTPNAHVCKLLSEIHNSNIHTTNMKFETNPHPRSIAPLPLPFFPHPIPSLQPCSRTPCPPQNPDPHRLRPASNWPCNTLPTSHHEPHRAHQISDACARLRTRRLESVLCSGPSWSNLECPWDLDKMQQLPEMRLSVLLIKLASICWQGPTTQTNC